MGAEPSNRYLYFHGVHALTEVSGVIVADLLEEALSIHLYQTQF